MPTGISFRLTFNKPAGTYYLDGNAVVALAYDHHGVYITPMRSPKGEKCVTLIPRGERGGYEATVDGADAKGLLRAFEREASTRQPFFLLQRHPEKPGVLRLVHFRSDKPAPAKIDPHLRVWFPQPSAAERRAVAVATEMGSEVVPSANGAVDPEEIERDATMSSLSEVRDAHAVLAEQAENRRIGRPTREVQHAREVMAAFDEVVRLIRPSPFAHLSPGDAKVAQDVLGRVSRILEESLRTEDAPPPAAALPPPAKVRREVGSRTKAGAKTSRAATAEAKPARLKTAAAKGGWRRKASATAVDGDSMPVPMVEARGRIEAS